MRGWNFEPTLFILSLLPAVLSQIHRHVWYRQIPFSRLSCQPLPWLLRLLVLGSLNWCTFGLFLADLDLRFHFILGILIFSFFLFWFPADLWQQFPKNYLTITFCPLENFSAGNGFRSLILGSCESYTCSAEYPIQYLSYKRGIVRMFEIVRQYLLWKFFLLHDYEPDSIWSPFDCVVVVRVLSHICDTSKIS